MIKKKKISDFDLNPAVLLSQSLVPINDKKVLQYVPVLYLHKPHFPSEQTMTVIFDTTMNIVNVSKTTYSNSKGHTVDPGSPVFPFITMHELFSVIVSPLMKHILHV